MQGRIFATLNVEAYVRNRAGPNAACQCEPELEVGSGPFHCAFVMDASESAPEDITVTAVGDPTPGGTGQ
jgi:hypothetical protein